MLKLFTIMLIVCAVYGVYGIYREIKNAPYINDDLTEKPDSGAQNSAK